MNNDLLNRVKVHFAQGDKELSYAKNNLNKLYEGKIRASSRRAAGFYLDGLGCFSNLYNYGNSFMNHLRALESGDTIPQNVRLASRALITKITNENLSGQDAIENAETIINFCREELNRFLIKEKHDGKKN